MRSNWNRMKAVPRSLRPLECRLQAEIRSVDLASWRRRVRRAYELGRFRRALARSTPALVLAAAAATWVGHALVPLAMGVGLYAASVGLLWWGREPGWGVLPGLAYGLLPLGAALLASVCVPGTAGETSDGAWKAACVGAAFVAGSLIAWRAVRSQHHNVRFLSAALVAFLTGAIGSACLGLYPLVGTAVAISIAFIVAVVLRSAACGVRGRRRSSEPSGQSLGPLDASVFSHEQDHTPARRARPRWRRRERARSYRRARSPGGARS